MPHQVFQNNVEHEGSDYVIRYPAAQPAAADAAVTIPYCHALLNHAHAPHQIRCSLTRCTSVEPDMMPKSGAPQKWCPKKCGGPSSSVQPHSQSSVMMLNSNHAHEFHLPNSFSTCRYFWACKNFTVPKNFPQVSSAETLAYKPPARRRPPPPPPLKQRKKHRTNKRNM